MSLIQFLISFMPCFTVQFGVFCFPNYSVTASSFAWICQYSVSFRNSAIYPYFFSQTNCQIYGHHSARDPRMVLEQLAKQNETLNVLSWKLTSSKEVKTNKDEVETSLQIMLEVTELKALDALEYP